MPLVDWILYVTNTILITKYLHVLGLPWHEELWNLYITIVISKVKHVILYFGKLRLVPAQRLHVHEAIKVVNTECNFEPVSRCHLDLVLTLSRHGIADVDPGLSWVVFALNNIKPIAIGIRDVLILIWTLVLLVWSVHYASLSALERSSVWQVLVNVFHFKSSTWIVHHFWRLLMQLNF